MNLTELSFASGMTKNKAFRLLTTMEQQGMIDKDKEGRYYFGINTFIAARNALTRIDIPEVFPFLEKVAMQLNEDVYLARKTTGLPLLVDFANSRQQVTVRSCIGCVLRDQGNENTRELVRVSVGALDPDVTTVAIDLPISRNRETGALVVVAPTFRMSPERIRSEVIPVLQETVRQMGYFQAESMVRTSHLETVQDGQKRRAKDHLGASVQIRCP